MFAKDCKKIIATTDSSLRTKVRTMKQTDNLEVFLDWLPEPSQSFLEVYVREYNKGNVIKEVMVEYERDGIGFTHDKHGKELPWKLKVNPKDNTVTIRRVKDSWTREDVITSVLKMQHDYGQYKDTHIDADMREIAEWTDRWIEENL